MLDFQTLSLATHVILGTFAVAMGTIALAARKGALPHIGAGRLFVVSMGLSSLFGAGLGLVAFETLYITFHAGLLGTTLVVSGVLAARITAADVRPWFMGVAGLNALNTAGLLVAGLFAITLPESLLFGFPAADYLFLCGMASVALISDGILILWQDVTDRHRIAQHLWRMCTGFFIAAGSAFTGPGATAFPEVIRASGVLSLPELIIMILMVFWLIKTLRRRRATPALAR